MFHTLTGPEPQAPLTDEAHHGFTPFSRRGAVRLACRSCTAALMAAGVAEACGVRAVSAIASVTKDIGRSDGSASGVLHGGRVERGVRAVV